MLIGREREVQRVGALLAGGWPVVIVGPAGIGKTALARQVLGRLGPYRETGALASLRWRPLVPFARLLEREPPPDVALAAAAVIRHGRGPLLFDDVQWADDVSFEVLGALVGRVPILATVRTGEDGVDEALGVLALLGFERLDLGPLADAAATDLVSWLHPSLSDERRVDLVTRASGNPLLLTELGRTVGATSPSLAAALRDRAEDLSPAGLTALQRLAVLARPCGPDVLGPGVAELLAVGLAVPDGPQFALSHALVGEVFAETMAGEHDRVLLEVVPLVGPGEAAHLLERVGRRTEARSRALEGAADAPDSARLPMLELAVRCGDSLDLERRFDLARLLVKRGRAVEARAVCADGLDLATTPVERGTLLVADAEGAWALGQREEAMSLVAEAVDLLRGSDTAAEVLALTGRTFFNSAIAFDPASGIELAREAVAVAERIGGQTRFAHWRLAALLQASGQPGWESELELVLAACEAAGDEELRHLATVTTILFQWMSGDTAAAEARARQEGARIGPSVETLDAYILGSYQALLGLQAGRAPEGLIAGHLDLLDEPVVFAARPFLTTAMAIALGEAGRYDEAIAIVETAWGTAGDDPQAVALAAWGSAELGWQYGRSGLVDDALAALDGPAALHPAATPARLVAAHERIGAGLAPSGEAPAGVAGFLAGAPEEWRALECWAAGDLEAAASAFAAASVAWVGVDERARWRAAWAAAECARLAGWPEAIEQLRVVEQHGAQFGYRSIAVRTARSLRQAGARPRSSGTPQLGGLTSREVEVLDLVAMGMSTHEVAAALVLAPSTVETVLASARRRLGAPTRVAAVAELARLRAELTT